MVCSDSKLSITAVTAPVHQQPPTARPTYLTGPYTADAAVYSGDQWPDNGRDSALAGAFNHAYYASSFYPVRAAYPAEQPEVDSGSGFPGRAPSGRNTKLKSEPLPVVGVC